MQRVLEREREHQVQTKHPKEAAAGGNGIAGQIRRGGKARYAQREPSYYRASEEADEGWGRVRGRGAGGAK